MEKVVVYDMNQSQVEITTRVFSTAYHLTKHDRPYSDHTDLLELQILNGAKMGIGLRSRYSATSIIDHTSKEMKKNICSKIVELGRKISVLVDKSTAYGKTVLIIYLKSPDFRG